MYGLLVFRNRRVIAVDSGHICLKISLVLFRNKGFFPAARLLLGHCRLVFKLFCYFYNTLAYLLKNKFLA